MKNHTMKAPAPTMGTDALIMDVINHLQGGHFSPSELGAIEQALRIQWKRNPLLEETYPNGEVGMFHESRNYRFRRTGEMRAPKKGEWYLSGAIPTAYRAPNDLKDTYYILTKV
jgi:hypothetical protein